MFTHATNACKHEFSCASRLTVRPQPPAHDIHNIHVQEPITSDELLIRLNSEDICNMLVMLVRFVASAHIFTREDHFLPFILGTMDNCLGIDDFRRRYVEVMGEESDHIQCVALSEAFRVLYSCWFCVLAT
jgi:hypothetical protein